MKTLYTTALCMLAFCSAQAKTHVHVSLTYEEVDDYRIDSISKISLNNERMTLEIEKKDGSTIEYERDSVELIMFGDECNGHEYIDLGLSVYWATVNVGAEVPNEAGTEYAWGRLEPYTGGDMGGAYPIGTELDVNFDIAGTRYDVARAKWGDEWQMPTVDHWVELMENCTFTWKKYNGVEGYEVKSNKNGNWIFLPALGNNINKRWYYMFKPFGSYWSSTPIVYEEDDPYNMPNIYSYVFDIDNSKSMYTISYSFRESDDELIRPVLPKD